MHTLSCVAKAYLLNGGYVKHGSCGLFLPLYQMMVLLNTGSTKVLSSFQAMVILGRLRVRVWSKVSLGSLVRSGGCA